MKKFTNFRTYAFYSSTPRYHEGGEVLNGSRHDPKDIPFPKGKASSRGSNNIILRKYCNFFIVILLFTVVVFVQLFFDLDKSKAKYNEPYIVQSKIVKMADLGLHNAAADFLWLASIQYFGGWESRTNEKMSEYLFNATELDPQFSYPYAFGVLILPSLNQMDKALELGQKGVDLKLADWRIPYYMATTYYINKDDNANAAKYFDIAANTKGAPDNIAHIAARFGSNTSKRAQTIQIWQGIYETTNDEVVKERAKNYIIHLQIMDILDQAISIYFNYNKKYPENISDLVQAKIINQVPLDPFGFEYIVTDGKATIK